MGFVGDHTLQIGDLVALGGHLFGENLDLEGERFLVALQPAQAFVSVLALQIGSLREQERG